MQAIWYILVNATPLLSSELLIMVFLGVGVFVLTYIYMVIWNHTGEVNAKRIRERYLQAVLRQDIQFFDKVGAGEIASRIQTDTRAFYCYTSNSV